MRIRRADKWSGTTTIYVCSFIRIYWFGRDPIRHLKAYRWESFLFIEISRLGFQLGSERKLHGNVADAS